MPLAEKTENAWSSRPTFLLAAIGGAVGLGNLWRFPYIAGEYGGGAFVLVYLGFVFLLGTPLMAGELLIGRRGHRSPISSISSLIRAEDASPFWHAIGWISTLVPFLGLSYYAVVAAWAIDYLSLAAGDNFNGFDAVSSANTFNARIDKPVYQGSLHALFIAATVWIVANGITKGIERATKILMPALFAVILIIVGYGMFAGDFEGAARFLFNPDFDSLTGESVLVALGQALFSLGIGVGLMITYSAYMSNEYSLRTSAIFICVGDTFAALLAGFAIFPIVFASGLDPAQGAGLIFVTLPIGFGNMPGGQIIGTLFFVLLLFAAFTTAIGMLEPVVSWLEEKYPGGRKKVAIFAGCIIWVVGLGSVFSFSFMSDFQPLSLFGIERNFFGIVDFTVANVLAPINAFLIALFAGWVLRQTVIDQEFDEASSRWKSYWRLTNRYVAPAALIIIFLDLVTA